jgi:hypothetical protein
MAYRGKEPTQILRGTETQIGRGLTQIKKRVNGVRRP